MNNIRYSIFLLGLIFAITKIEASDAAPIDDSDSELRKVAAKSSKEDTKKGEISSRKQYAIHQLPLMVFSSLYGSFFNQQRRKLDDTLSCQSFASQGVDADKDHLDLHPTKSNPALSEATKLFSSKLSKAVGPQHHDEHSTNEAHGKCSESIVSELLKHKEKPHDISAQEKASKKYCEGLELELLTLSYKSQESAALSRINAEISVLKDKYESDVKQTRDEYNIKLAGNQQALSLKLLNSEFEIKSSALKALQKAKDTVAQDFTKQKMQLELLTAQKSAKSIAKRQEDFIKQSYENRLAALFAKFTEDTIELNNAKDQIALEIQCKYQLERLKRGETLNLQYLNEAVPTIQSAFVVEGYETAQQPTLPPVPSKPQESFGIAKTPQVTPAIPQLLSQPQKAMTAIPTLPQPQETAGLSIAAVTEICSAISAALSDGRLNVLNVGANPMPCYYQPPVGGVQCYPPNGAYPQK